MLPVVLYNGAARWKAALDVADPISPVGPSLAPYQPSQRYVVLDEQHVGDDDLPGSNLMAAVISLELSRSPADLVRALEMLRECLRGPGDAELRRAFVEWVLRLAPRLVPDEGGEPLSVRTTLERMRRTW